MPKLIHKIHGKNIYKNFKVEGYKLDVQGWGADSAIFSEIIKKYKPKLVIEVGTWKGASAIHMAKLVKKFKLKNTEIVCVDTWLGSNEHWRYQKHPDHFPSLKTKHGFPQIYFQFLANVVLSKVSDVIIPLPMASIQASYFLKTLKTKADVIYIDAGHEYQDVKLDIESYWKLLKKDGIMFGDDFNSGWPGVIRAVHEFSEENQLNFMHTRDGKWFVQKID